MNPIITDVIDMIELVKKHRNDTMDAIISVLKDETIPVDERWAIFEVCDFLPTKSYPPINTFNGNEISWYDDMYVERGTTVDFTRVVERFQENDYLDGYDDPEVIEKFKNDILTTGYRYFIYDW